MNTMGMADRNSIGDIQQKFCVRADFHSFLAKKWYAGTLAL
jgi:hypothetical protein